MKYVIAARRRIIPKMATVHFEKLFSPIHGIENGKSESQKSK